MTIPDGRRGFAATARQGTRIFFGPVGPQDEQRLREGVGALSPASRYLRFFSPAHELTEEQIDRFVHPDQVDHVAWGALDLSRDGLPGLGLGRMVRLADDPVTAEMAIAVIDRAQNLGIGTILLATLCALARRGGIYELQAWVLPQNEAVLEWFTRLGASVRRDQGACDVRLPVPEEGVGAGCHSVDRLRAMIAAVERVLPPAPG